MSIPNPDPTQSQNMLSSLLLLATSLALLELDELALVADTLALVRLWGTLPADGCCEVTNQHLVGTADGQGGVLLNLQGGMGQLVNICRTCYLDLRCIKVHLQ